MRRVVSYFFQGLVFLVPIALTAWLIASVFVTLDGWVRGSLGIAFPGSGVVLTLVFVTLIGVFASHFFTRRLFVVFERVIERVPVVKLLHGSVRDLMNAFVGPDRRFDRPVLVDLSAQGQVRALGFVTRESLDPYDLPDSVAVYFPQAYNFAGQLVIVPRTAVRPVALPPSEVMTFIVSGGISGR